MTPRKELQLIVNNLIKGRTNLGLVEDDIKRINSNTTRLTTHERDKLTYAVAAIGDAKIELASVIAGIQDTIATLEADTPPTTNES